MLYDIVIIGAGITGSMLARELSRYELKVAVLDKENDIANGATMANSAIAADFGESLDVHGDLSSQITLDNLSFSDHFGNLLDFVIGEILDSRVRIHAGLGQNSVGTRHTDTIDIGESDFNTLLSR